MAKPFSIQSPEDIAKEYAGNKQKIAQAMQLGVVDPTAGVLAGMFIDRMRSAQMQEQAPQTTVAQQVMGGAQPAPPAAPAGGLGATPQVAPPMAPQMAAPVPQGAPVGMAEGGMVPPYAAGGGLSDVPVPDGMFDEPSNGGFNDGYAGGGLVAFAGGSPGELKDPSDWGSYIEQMALSVAPNLGVTSRQRSAARNQQVGGVSDSYHKLDAARDFVPPKGVTMGQLHAQLKQQFGSGYDVINEGDHVHIEPGPALGRVVRAGTPFDPANVGRLRKAEDRPGAAAPASGGLGGLKPPTETLEGMFPGAIKEAEDYYTKNMPERKNEGLGLLTKAARETLDPENQKKRADQDKWMMLAEIGFNMASSNSPYLLQAASAAAAAALPGARAAKKEREADKREAIRDLASAEDITYKQAAEKANFIRDLAKTKLDIKDKDLTRASNIWERMYSETAATDRTAMQVQGQKDVEGMRIDGDLAKGPGGMSSSQLTDLSGQFKSRAEDALKAMAAAEKVGDFAQFQTASANYKNALTGYNDITKRLGLPGMGSVKMGMFPKMARALQQSRAAAPQRAAPAGGGINIISAEPIPQ